MINLIQIAFFSACVSCGLAVLRNTKLNILLFVFSSAFCAAFVFNFVNGMGYTFLAGVLGGFISAVMVGISHRKGIHSYLFIVIPVIYCMGPGGALYKFFFDIINFQRQTILVQLVYILKDAFGLWTGIMVGTRLMNIVSSKKSEEF